MVLATLTLCAIAVGGCPCDTQPSGFAGGTGTPEDPYQICSPQQLAQIADAPTAHYILTADLNLAGLDWQPINTPDQDVTGTSSAGFTGDFDGGGHTIWNLNSGNRFVVNAGLFEHIGVGGTVHDLHFENAVVEAWSYGGVVAARNQGVIERCSASGTAKGNRYIGGIVGANHFVIRDCASHVNVSVKYRGGGGLAGLTYYDQTGLVGYRYCYAAGRITGNGHRGALIGMKIGGVGLTANYWDVESCGTEEPIGNGTYDEGIFGLSTGAMMQGASYEQWDFENTWKIDENYGYPIHRNRTSGGCCVGDMTVDNTVDIFDLLKLIEAWGDRNSRADLNAVGGVGYEDLMTLLGNWGPCE